MITRQELKDIAIHSVYIYPIMTAIIACLTVALVLVACFVSWSFEPLWHIGWGDFRVVMVIGALVSFVFLRDPAKNGGKRYWHKPTKDKWCPSP